MGVGRGEAKIWTNKRSVCNVVVVVDDDDSCCSVVVVIWAHWERQGPKGARGNDPIDAPTRPFGPGILACDQPRSSHSMGIPRYRIRDALVCTVYIYDIYGICVCMYHTCL